MTSARWSMPRPIAACSTPSPASRRTSRRWKQLWDAQARRQHVLDEHRADMERAAREADYLRHASDELKKLAPKDGEETALAERRTTMMQGEKIAADLREAQDAVGGNHSPVPALSAAVRRLERRAGKFAGAGRARGEGDRCRDQRAGGGRPAPHRRADRGGFRSRASSNASRSGCSRCAPRRANIRRRSMAWRRWPRNTPPTWR